jgi:hypothetical protein|tara:strand:- start:560 stop:682 length:123 start_codon:yes stop_codon:yes gene_type:complete
MALAPEKTDSSKIADILGYFWSLSKEDQKLVLKILQKGKK